MSPTLPQSFDQCAAPPTGPIRPVPWAQNRLTMDRVWALTKGNGVKVAVVDSGVDADVPQLAGRVLHGVDVVNPAGGPADTDCAGHGTSVAGVIAGQPIKGVGFSGVAPGVKILPVRDANAQNQSTAISMARGIRAAVDGGAKVINLANSQFFPSIELRSAVAYAAGKDVLIVAPAAASNTGSTPPTYPAAYPQVLAVGSVGPDGNPGSGSATGYYLDLVAPGEGITTLGRGGPGQVQKSGADMAAPFVAGTAALVRAYHPNLTAAQVMKRLELTADHPGGAVPDVKVGYGVVNPYAAIAAVIPGETAAKKTTKVSNPAATTSDSPASGKSTTGDLGGASGDTAGDTSMATGETRTTVVTKARPVPETKTRDTALVFAVLAGAVGVVLAFFAVVLPRGRRRGWRPGGSEGDSNEPRIRPHVPVSHSDEPEAQRT